MEKLEALKKLFKMNNKSEEGKKEEDRWPFSGKTKEQTIAQFKKDI